jgi:hypothetical protein
VNSDAIYDETLGDYWLAQQLCQSICAAANVLQTVETQQQITTQLLIPDDEFLLSQCLSCSAKGLAVCEHLQARLIHQ